YRVVIPQSMDAMADRGETSFVSARRQVGAAGQETARWPVAVSGPDSAPIALPPAPAAEPPPMVAVPAARMHLVRPQGLRGSAHVGQMRQDHVMAARRTVRDTVIVANRWPVRINRQMSTWEVSPGGLVSAMSSVLG